MGEEAVQSKIEIIGKQFPSQGFIPKALETGAKQGGIIPKEVYGVEFKSSTVQIRNFNGEIIGTFTIALSLKNQNALKEATQSLSDSTKQLTAASEEIASSALHLSNNVADILN